MKRRFFAVLLVMLLLAGCGGKQNKAEKEASAGQGTEVSPARASSEEVLPGQDVFEETPEEMTTADMLRSMRIFSKWDRNDTVDREFCTEIILNGSSAKITGRGAAAEGSTVTITEAGDYYLTGTLGNGQIVVKADPLAKIRLILAGVNVTCEDSACLLVRMADKVILTLADGTVNRFSDGGKTYVARDDIYGVDAVLFAKEDLTINGPGSLIVEAGYAHGICTKDDLVLLGGTVSVTAKDKGLIGEDSIRVKDCTLTVNAADDAVCTKTTYKEGKGFVYFGNGTVTLSCGDRAVSAATVILVDGAEITVTECKEGLVGTDVVTDSGNVRIMGE